MNRDLVLVVDDEPRIQRLVGANLRAAGYQATCAATGQEALSLLEVCRPRLVLLDLGLPDMDGLDVFSHIRDDGGMPVIIVTARGQSADKVKGLDLGADDYLVKPFDVDELLARVRAVLRRFQPGNGAGSAPSRIAVGALCLDLNRYEARLHGEVLQLTRTEFKLLSCLAVHADKVMLHEQLLSQVWGPEYRDALEYLRVTIGRLRRKLGDDDPEFRLIETVSGVGYRLVPCSPAVLPRQASASD